ncbi:MAG: hypothetical protein JRG73_02355 [Deltaproteobacteria bacterium]|nr:hypothetical protein [Deltaproteobacteria bacterium]
MFRYRTYCIPGLSLLLLGTIALVISCSGGSGSPDRVSAPGDENVPARVIVSSDRTVVDVVTGDNTVTLIAEVINEEGQWMPDVLVAFHTSFGVLNHTGPDVAVPTDSDGIARAVLSSSSEGMAIVEIQAQDVADYTLISFVDFTTAEQQRNYRVLLTAEPASLPGDGATPSRLTAFVVDGNNRPVEGITVTFLANNSDASFNEPIFTGGAGGTGGTGDTDGTGTSRISGEPAFQTDTDTTFFLSFSATTDASGRAQVDLFAPRTVVEQSIILRAQVFIPALWVVNEPPQWYGGESVTIYDITSVSVNAPTIQFIQLGRAGSLIVPPGGADQVAAMVQDINGFPMPGNTVVNFSVLTPNMGWVEAFAYTGDDGVALATYYADTSQTGPVTISARANGVTTSGQVFYVSTLDPTVEPLGLAPAEADITGSGGTAVFTIVNGIPPFDISTDQPQYLGLTLNPDDTITVVGVNVPREMMTATLTVSDATFPEREAATATINLGEVDTEQPLSLSPPSVTLVSAGQTFVFGINNGIPPFGVSTDRPDLIEFSLGHNNTVEVQVLNIPDSDTTAKLYVRDATTRTPAQATITLEAPTPVPTPLTVTPSSGTVTFGPGNTPQGLLLLATGGSGAYTWTSPSTDVRFDNNDNGTLDPVATDTLTIQSISGQPVRIFGSTTATSGEVFTIIVSDIAGEVATVAITIGPHP